MLSITLRREEPTRKGRIENIKVDEEIPHARRLRKRVSIDAVIKACQLFRRKSESIGGEDKKGNERR